MVRGERRWLYFRLARNARLEAEIAQELAEAEQKAAESGKPERIFKEFEYQTRKTWSRPAHRGQSRTSPKGRQSALYRYLAVHRRGPSSRALRDHLCARGEMENRIKECQLDLMADRTSAATLRANQLRLWFSSLAYVLITALRRLALQGTELANATAGPSG